MCLNEKGVLRIVYALIQDLPQVFCSYVKNLRENKTSPTRTTTSESDVNERHIIFKKKISNGVSKYSINLIDYNNKLIESGSVS